MRTIQFSLLKKQSLCLPIFIRIAEEEEEDTHLLQRQQVGLQVNLCFSIFSQSLTASILIVRCRW